ncbi:hypothetical protein LCGC14_2025160 [marine sediment metagenome]|uniref:Uncharacterized protein n=1 Tax=marine sediment metagenome TaxID=412755 RepID=A0A0F9HTF0_9ZZZZ
MSNAPDVLFGLVPLVRAVVRSSSSATDTAVTADDSGTLFINLSTSAHTYTLPTLALSKGKHWLFFNGQSTAALSITGGTTDKIIGVDDLNGDTITCGGEAGDIAIVICDGTWYYAITMSGKPSTAGVWTVSS